MTRSEYESLVSDDRGLGTLFHQQFQTAPEAIAVSDLDVSLTYRQLHGLASDLATILVNENVKNEEPIGILTQHGITGVIAQVAITYTGGSCVPLDPTLSADQLQHRLRRLRIRFVLTDNPGCLQGLESSPTSINIVIDRNNMTRSLSYREDGTYIVPVNTTLDHCTHLIHTSGTTADPKIVRIAGRSILHTVFHAPFKPLDASDVVGHGNNTSFDVSLFDIWAPLLRGAKIVIINKATLLNPTKLERYIELSGMTVMVITSALVNLIAFNFPRALARLRTCIFGGENANAAALEIILKEGPPTTLINAYGPTECCIYCLAHPVTMASVRRGFVSIGNPIGNNVIQIIGDDGHPSNTGELLVGGPGVTPGYLEDISRNSTAFRVLPISQESKAHQMRFYRTGDIVRRHDDGSIEFLGRRDHQVKIRGFRIELEAVELALLKTGLIAEAAAMKIDVPCIGAGSILVAYGVPTINTDYVKVSKLIRSRMENLVPRYMIPNLELVSCLPLTKHGKLDRDFLSNQYKRNWDQKLIPSRPLDEIESKLLTIWCVVLGFEASFCKEDDDFMLLGASSLQISMLVSQIKLHFRIEMSMTTLFTNTTMGSLLAMIRLRIAGQKETLQDEISLWEADSRLGDSLPLPGRQTANWCDSQEGVAFLTGATGFVGAFFLADLLAMDYVKCVVCLTRASSSTAGMERLQHAFSEYNLCKDQLFEKVVVVCGTIEDEFLGLGWERYEQLSNQTSVVFHLAALVNYTKPYRLHRSANTIGTLNMVKFACAGRVKPLHYVSSISCFGPTGYVTGAKIIRENEPLRDHVKALHYDMGYAQSKWVADELVSRLVNRGFPIAIYRPGFICGHSKTGACNRKDFFSHLIRACHNLKCYPNLPSQRKEFLPVDFVTMAILHTAKSPTSTGRAYHVVPCDQSKSISMNETMELIGTCLGTHLQAIDYENWVKKLEELEQPDLTPLFSTLTEKVYDNRTRWELWEKMPIYDTSNLCKSLSGSVKPMDFPVLSQELMQKYISFLRANDWYV